MPSQQDGAFTTPQLYIPGQKNLPFSWRVLGVWLASAIWNSAVCFFVPVWALAPVAVSSTGLMIDIWATGTLAYTLIIVTVRTLLISCCHGMAPIMMSRLEEPQRPTCDSAWSLTVSLLLH